MSPEYGRRGEPVIDISLPNFKIFLKMVDILILGTTGGVLAAAKCSTRDPTAVSLLILSVTDQVENT